MKLIEEESLSTFGVPGQAGSWILNWKWEMEEESENLLGLRQEGTQRESMVPVRFCLNNNLGDQDKEY